jgi:hypothetical protein
MHLPAAAVRQTDFPNSSALHQFLTPADLPEQLQSAAQHSPVAANFVDGQPVSF